MAAKKSFGVAQKKKRVSAEFSIADDPDTTLIAYQPKAARLLPLAKLATAGEEDDLANAQVIEAFFDLVLAPESKAYLMDRLMNEEDDLDVEDLTPIIEWLQEQWTERPTGPSSGSGAQRRRSGGRSTGPVRSTA